MDYARELKIDRNALDDALVAQPGLYDKVATDWAEALSKRDQQKKDLESTRARIELKIRRKLEEAGDKVTEATVKSMVDRDEVYREAINEYLESCKEADILLGHKEAFAQRAFVLKDLCQLFIGGYFSTSSVNGGAASEVSKQRYEKNRQVIAKARRERQTFDD